jgi:hypothetical protein
MPVYRTIPTNEQPELTLRDWWVARLADSTVHLIGYCVENDEGRVSSEVQSFAIGRSLVLTSTGRVYRLLGEPGLNMDASYTWNRWLRMYGLESWEDITEAAFENLMSTDAPSEELPAPIWTEIGAINLAGSPRVVE